MTWASDIYIRADCYAPHTRAGLWLLAHEVAHVRAAAPRAGRGGAPDRRLGGRPTSRCGGKGGRRRSGRVPSRRRFVSALRLPGRRHALGEVRVVQRYSAWEHLLLGNLDPATSARLSRYPAGVSRTAPSASWRRNARYWRSSAQSGRRGHGPVGGDYPGIQTVRLSASGLVVSLGEINVLADYLSHPLHRLASAAFIVPVVQAIRSQSYRELHRIMGEPAFRGRAVGHPAIPESASPTYPDHRDHGPPARSASVPPRNDISPCSRATPVTSRRSPGTGGSPSTCSRGR